jgi:hypothetical protein
MLSILFAEIPGPIARALLDACCAPSFTNSSSSSSADLFNRRISRRVPRLPLHCLASDFTQVSRPALLDRLFTDASVIPMDLLIFLSFEPLPQSPS